jgi:hypothetical protein
MVRYFAAVCPLVSPEVIAEGTSEASAFHKEHLLDIYMHADKTEDELAFGLERTDIKPIGKRSPLLRRGIRPDLDMQVPKVHDVRSDCSGWQYFTSLYG